MRGQLGRVRDTNHFNDENGQSPIYTLRKHWDYDTNHMLEFVVMSNRNEEGQFFSGAVIDQQSYHEQIFNGEVHVTTIYTDAEGAWSPLPHRFGTLNRTWLPSCRLTSR